MLNNKLKVKIPKKFKKQLIARFSVSKAKKELGIDNNWAIEIRCPLCEYYYKMTCTNCPFNEFKFAKVSGCFLWIIKVLGNETANIITLGSSVIYWSLENNKKARKLLKKLKTQAKKYIEWV